MSRRRPKHRGSWNPLHPRVLGGPGPLVVGAIAAALVGAAALLGSVPDGTGGARALAGAESLPSRSSVSDPISFAGESAVGSNASILASSVQDPRALVSGPAESTGPVRLSIESIGVEVDLTRLDRRGDGSLEPPTGLMEAGWYQDSAVPGAVGPAVIAGHVDDTEDAGIFARLHELEPGTEIVITLSDGTREIFTTDFLVDVAKAEFPTEAVYGATRTPQLRLITCNGPYDFDSMHYSNNLVLFASHRSA